jgi:hypothetical protein
MFAANFDSQHSETAIFFLDKIFLEQGTQKLGQPVRNQIYQRTEKRSPDTIST